MTDSEYTGTQEQPDDLNYEEAIEAILFAAGHPVTYEQLARTFELRVSQVKRMVEAYAQRYNAPSDIPRGVILLTYENECQLCTKHAYISEIRSALGIKKSGTLSTSSIETIAIIAYNQPVTRAFVDAVRGVDSSYAVTNLLERGLIESKGRLEAPGRPMLYGTTNDFLRCFGLKSLEELPCITREDIAETFSGARAQEQAAIDEAQQQAQTEQENAPPEKNAEPLPASAEEHGGTIITDLSGEPIDTADGTDLSEELRPDETE